MNVVVEVDGGSYQDEDDTFDTLEEAIAAFKSMGVSRAIVEWNLPCAILVNGKIAVSQ